MRLVALAFLLTPLLLAASAPAEPQAEPLEQKLSEARAQQAAAEAETQRLERAAASKRDEAERLQAQQAAAAQAIDAAEARITAADTQFRLAAAYVAADREVLAREQRPASSLLAALALTAQRPPLLVLLDGRGTDDLVKMSVLLDSTLPVIRNRTGALSRELAKAQQLQAAALLARAELIRSREQLAARRAEFAQLELRALDRSFAEGRQAVSVGDAAIAAGDEVDRIQRKEAENRSAREIANLLLSEAPAPMRPFAAQGPVPKPPLAYVLPVSAPVIEGLGAVDDSGVRSRGILFETARGTPVVAPADGTVRFSGPFRDYDGVLILDHGGGWMTLIVNVSSTAKPGDRVRLGELLGRTLGPLEVELSNGGRRFSPALIAGSSRSLSNGMKGG